jgi:hypothetical protein
MTKKLSSNQPLELLCLFLVAIWLALTPQEAKAGPAKEEVSAYVAGQIPAFMKLHSIEFRNFEADQAGLGRTSIVGHVAPIEDIYTRSFGAFEQALKSLGFTENEFRFYSRSGAYANGLQNAYALELSEGTKVKFTAELAYMMTVEGYRFSGRIRYDDIRGRPLSKVPADAVIRGSAAFKALVDSAVHTKTQQNQAKLAAKAEFAKILQSQSFKAQFPTDWDSDPPILEHYFTVSTKDELYWTEDPRNPTRMEFSIRGEAAWHRDGRWANSHFAAGSTVPIIMSGSVFEVAPQSGWRSSMVISVPNEQGAGFYHSSVRFAWRGQDFSAKAGVSGRLGWRLSYANAVVGTSVGETAKSLKREPSTATAIVNEAHISQSKIAGIWEGQTKCGSTPVHLKWTIDSSQVPRISGVEEFTSGNGSDSVYGSFRFSGEFVERSGSGRVEPGQWIQRPDGFYALGKHLTLHEERETILVQYPRSVCDALVLVKRK